MAQVITFEDYLPAPRYDATPWTAAELYEGTTATGPWTLIEVFTLSPVDADPENPAYRDFTTELADDAMDLWYYFIFKDASGDDSQPTAPVQNTESEAFSSYGSVSELFRILKIRTPSAEQTVAAQRVLLASAARVNSEIDLAEGSTLSGPKMALATEVCLEYACDLWRMQEVQIGLVGIGSEVGATYVARDLWEKHAISLEPCKDQFGFA